MFDYVRIASLVINTKVGDTIHNSKEIINKIETAMVENADIIITPELSLTASTCGDLFCQSELIDGAKKGLLAILKATKKYSGIIVIGMPVLIFGELYNCGVLCALGKVYGIVPKTFSDEHFSSVENLKTKKVSSHILGIEDEYDISVGDNLIFDIMGKVSFGVEVGESNTLSSSDFLALNGAEIIANITSSSAVATKDEKIYNSVKEKSKNGISVYAYVSQGAGESTSDCVYSGKSIIAEKGNVISENENLIDNDYIMLCDIDSGKIKADRMKSKAFKDASNMYGSLKKAERIFIDKGVFKSEGELYRVSKLPFVPDEYEQRLERVSEIFGIQVAGLKKRIEVTGGRPVIGISGGLDSTLALLVCAAAIKQLEKDSSEIVAVTMPGFGTTDRTYNNSLKLMEALGVTMREIPIKDACIQHFSDIGHDMNIHDVTYENSQARERTQILMDIANQINGFVVGTGDLSEVALGWCTYNGDQMSMYGVNAGVPKTLIRWIIDGIIENEVFEKCTDVLTDILDTPISPELLPPDANGKIAQKTEDLVGPYALHDFFIYYVVRYGFSPEKVFHLAKKAFKDDFDAETVLKWLNVFYRRFFTQQFKRTATPDSPKIGSVGLSPRTEWKMPSDATAKIWLEALRKMLS